MHVADHATRTGGVDASVYRKHWYGVSVGVRVFRTRSAPNAESKMFVNLFAGQSGVVKVVRRTTVPSRSDMSQNHPYEP